MTSLLLTAINFGHIRGRGFLGLEDVNAAISTGVPFTRLGITMSVIIGVLTTVSFLWLVFKLLIGAIGILSSGGDKAKLSQARGNITFALVGFVVVISSYFVLKLIGFVVGFDFLDMGELLIILTDLIPST